MFLVLHRYIFRELFRVFILTTLALTLILSLGSILRPIQEYGVGPQQVVMLLFYFLPVTLTFVLPMAALFASTLSYGRLAGDNEIDACKASGVSPLTLVYPGFVLALLVSIASLALSFYVMPHYILKAESAIKDDARQILFRNLQNQGYYSPPGGKISVYADYADPETNILSGVVVINTRGGGTGEIYTTEDARVSFRQEDLLKEIRIDAYNVGEVGRTSDFWVTSERASAEIPFPSVLQDKISFLPVEKLKEIKVNPFTFRPIADKIATMRERLVLELLLQELTDVLSTGHPYTLQGTDRIIHLRAKQADLGSDQIDLSQGIEVKETDEASGKTRTLTCTKGTLDLNIQNDVPTLVVALSNVSSSDSVGIIMRYPVRGLRLPVALKPYFSDEQLGALLSPEVFTPLRQGPSEELTGLHQQLQNVVQSTLADLRSEVHSRLVFGLGCIPMILIGIGLGIIKRGGHMLSAFGASCIPALVLVVGMVSGKQLMGNAGVGGLFGVVLIWSGLVTLWIICAHVFRKLVRN